MTGPAHLTREELQRWWTHGDPGDRDRIVNHLADCDECGALYAELIDRQPVAADTTEAPRQLVARAYRAYTGPRDRFRWWSGSGLVAAGALAALILALAVPVLRNSSTPPMPEDATIRGASLQAIEPIGETRPPLRFRWASPVAAARFAIEIRDADGRLLLTLSSETERLSLPAARLVEIEAGRRYTWQVVALSADNEAIMRSEPRSFVVLPEGR